MLLYSGLPIAGLELRSRTRGTEEHMEQKDTRTRGEAKTKSNAMATLHRYKRGHTPRIQMGLKRPTLAWNELKFVTLGSFSKFV